MMIALSVIAAATSTAAFAQSEGGLYQAPQAAVQGTAVTKAQADAAAVPYGDTLKGKTRAEVYQELVQAEQDGSLERLNTTLYKNP
ncbi:DUF4148 domain-containing protein [Trinickia fusca]|uniref:DUF4148 domain-containing protein n=2 Tax=Trinickia fusca TaxID=2419777 RepID=A0A494XC71_9BURK|nr:DUF4148 domain-containing protein [Trinickia fusca]